jgi:hypothetical protein
MSARRSTYEDIAEGLGHWSRQFARKTGNADELAPLLFVLLAILLVAAVAWGISLLTLPGFAMATVVAWLATARLAGNPPMRVRTAAAAVAAGVVVFKVASANVEPSAHTTALDIGLFAAFGLGPTIAVGFLLARREEEAWAARPGTACIDPAGLSEELRGIVRKRAGGTMRGRPFRADEEERLTAAELRRMIEEETTEKEQLARQVEAETRAFAAETERRRLADYYNALSALPPEERALIEAQHQAGRLCRQSRDKCGHARELEREMAELRSRLELYGERCGSPHEAEPVTGTGSRSRRRSR